MTGRPDSFMPFYIADYLADTGHLSTIEHGAYLLLLFHYWRTGKALPDDDQTLRKITRMSITEWDTVSAPIRSLFRLATLDAKKVLVSKRVEEELLRATSRYDRAKKASAAANKAKKDAAVRIAARSAHRIGDLTATETVTETVTETDIQPQPQPHYDEDGLLRNPDAPSGAVADRSLSGSEEIPQTRLPALRPSKPPAFTLPDWLPSEAWADFVQMRNRVRAPMTERAKVLLVSKLDQMRAEGHDPVALLNQSIVNSWKGVFPINEISRGGKPYDPKDLGSAKNRRFLNGLARAQEHFEGIGEAGPGEGEGGDLVAGEIGGPPAIRSLG